MMQKLVRNNGKRPLVVLCCFKKNVPKVNKKSELIDMIDKIPLLRNMRSCSLRLQCAVMFQKFEFNFGMQGPTLKEPTMLNSRFYKIPFYDSLTAFVDQ